MSQASNLPNGVKPVKDFIEMLSKIPYVSRVLIHGSRSPKRNHSPRKESDWDLIAVVSKKHLVLPHPRKYKMFHGDLITIHKDAIKDNLENMCAEIWPTDEYEILVNGGFVDADK